MSYENSSDTLYAVARDDSILGIVHPTPESAQAELATFESRMRDLGLEPDVRIVTISRRISYGKLKDYHPTDTTVEKPDEDDADSTDTTDGSTSTAA